MIYKVELQKRIKKLNRINYHGCKSFSVLMLNFKSVHFSSSALSFLSRKTSFLDTKNKNICTDLESHTTHRIYFRTDRERTSQSGFCGK